MIEFEDDFEIPVDEPTQPVMEPVIANEQAFYTAEVLQDPESDIQEPVRMELENQGTSIFHSTAEDIWQREQDALDNNILLEIVKDSSIPPNEKAGIIRAHSAANNKSTNLKDKFVSDNAALDISPVGRSDMAIRAFDKEAQDLWVDTLTRRQEASNELQRLRTSIAAERDSSAGSVIGGILMDFLPFAFPNFRAAAAAAEAGLTLETDVIASQSDYEKGLNDLSASFLLTGSVNTRVQEAFEAAPPEQQIQILKDLVRGINSVPGTDFNKFIALEELLENPFSGDILTPTRNILSILEAHPLGQLITNPFRTIKWYTTFQSTATKGKATIDPVDGTTSVQEVDTFLGNTRILIPAPKAARKRKNKPESVQPNNDVIILDDKTIKETYSTLNEVPTTKFTTPTSGVGRGNVTDTVLQQPEVISDTLNENIVSGQNVGEQIAAIELLTLARNTPTAKDGKVFLDELWQQAGGEEVVSLKDFKAILLDMHIKGNVNLVKGKGKGKGVSPDKLKASSVIDNNDEILDMLDFSSPTAKREAEAILDVDAFGDDLAATALIEKVLNNIHKTPEKLIKDRAKKVYSSSFEAKQAGKTLVRVKTRAFDKIFANTDQYVGAGGQGGNQKKYDEFVKFFKETKNIEVGEVVVAKDGTVSFTDGRHRFAVLRDKGIRSIPIAMDPASILNAQRNGLLDDVAKETTKHPSQTPIARISRSVVPSVQPNSPAGALALANPVQAANKATEALAELSGGLAKRMGASRAQFFGDWVLPKLEKSLEEQFPEVANSLKKLDEIFEKNFKDAAIDPNIIPITEINKEVDLIVDTMREVKGARYQQANSTLHFSRMSVRGLAQFGRNDHYGFSSQAEAVRAFDQLVVARPNFPTRIIQKDNQYYIEQEWEFGFNQLDRFFFGSHSLQANFLGVDVSALARSKHGDLLIPKSMSDTRDLKRVGGAALNELKANRIESDFFKVIRQEILTFKMPLTELNTELRLVQEGQNWAPLGELSLRNAHLSQNKLDELVKGYSAYRRLGDYMYNWVNRLDRHNAEAAGHVGIYDPNGQKVGLGTKRFPESALSDVAEVWSYERNMPVPRPKDLQGREIFLARSPIRTEDGKQWDFVMLSGRYEAGILPSRTLPRVEGWIPRKNIENWYVRATPKSAIINGRKVTDTETLASRQRTVGAGMIREEALELSRRLGLENRFANDLLEIRPSTENVGNATITDYTMFAQTVKNSRKRGDRLPTLNGLAQIEDAVEALANTAKTSVRIQVWQDYSESFKKSFIDFAGQYTKGEFPTTLQGIVQKEAMTELELIDFKVAQNLLKQFLEVQTLMTSGDELWSGLFHKLADVLENVKLVGPSTSEAARAIARQGNLAARIPKTISTVLFIHTNPFRQLVIQPQQLMELNLILPEYAKQSALDVPAIILAMYSRANIIPVGHDEVLYNSARELSGMTTQEFDEVFEAIYNTGLPQAVDMNSMLLGMLEEAKFTTDPTIAGNAKRFLMGAVKAPGIALKTIGFTPAEMANNVGTWLFTRQRWLKDNPGKEWNTPENLTTITKQSWDISHSMIGKAGAFPYQQGMFSSLFQFVAIQHKGFAQTLMSKTLNRQEKIKITAARLALYGTYGIPLGAVGIGALFATYGSDEVQKEYQKHKGGFNDFAVNTLIDIWQQDPNSVSDIQISKALTPIPEIAPFADLFVETKRLLGGAGGGNPRFPFVKALSSIGEAIADIDDLYTTQELTTLEQAQIALAELAELSSGYNNFAKAMMINNWRDKTNKKGIFKGLELSDADAVFQMFGFITRQEENEFLIKDVIRQREELVRDAARDIVSSLVKLEDKIGTSDWEENKRRIQLLSTYLDDDVRNEVIEMVDRMQISQAKNEGERATIYNKIYRNKAGINDEHFQKMMDILNSSAESNAGDKRVVEELKNIQGQ